MQETTASGTQNNKSRKPLIIMLVVALLPMLGAYFVYFTGVFIPDHTVNAGRFVEPAQSLESLVSDDEWQEILSDKKWRLLLPVPSPCEQACKNNLYTTRQVHIRLDQKSKRLERLAVLSEHLSEQEVQQIKQDHPRLNIIASPLEQSTDWFEQLQLPEGVVDHYYLLVDQEGRAMMVYDNSQHGNDVLKDIKRAIKFSIDYQ